MECQNRENPVHHVAWWLFRDGKRRCRGLQSVRLRGSRRIRGRQRCRLQCGTGKEIGPPPRRLRDLYSVAFLGNTGEIAIASQQNTALWRYTKGTQCCEILSSSQPPRSPPPRLSRRSWPSRLRQGLAIIDVSGQKPRSRQLTSTPAITASFNQAGSEVVSAETSGDVAIYNVKAGDTVAQLVGDSAPETAAFSNDGKRVVAGYANGTALVWDLATELPLTVLNGNADAVNMAQFSTDGSQVVTAGADGTIRAWYAQPRELRTQFTSPVGGGQPPRTMSAAGSSTSNRTTRPTCSPLEVGYWPTSRHPAWRRTTPTGTVQEARSSWPGRMATWRS